MQLMGLKLVSEVRVSFKVWDEFLLSLLSVRMRRYDLLRNTQSHSIYLEQASSFWRCCCGRTITVDPSHQPSSNRWIVFSVHLLSLVSQISSPSKHPQHHGFTHKSPIWISTYGCSALYCPLLSLRFQLVPVSHKHTLLMQSPSLNVKTQWRKEVQGDELWFSNGCDFKAFNDFAMSETEPYKPDTTWAVIFPPLAFLDIKQLRMH